jgi:hypothetical protein
MIWMMQESWPYNLSFAPGDGRFAIIFPKCMNCAMPIIIHSTMDENKLLIVHPYDFGDRDSAKVHGNELAGPQSRSVQHGYAVDARNVSEWSCA